MSCLVYPASNSLTLPISVSGNTSPGHSLVDCDYSQQYLTELLLKPIGKNSKNLLGSRSPPLFLFLLLLGLLRAACNKCILPWSSYRVRLTNNLLSLTEWGPGSPSLFWPGCGPAPSRPSVLPSSSLWQHLQKAAEWMRYGCEMHGYEIIWSNPVEASFLALFVPVWVWVIWRAFLYLRPLQRLKMRSLWNGKLVSRTLIISVIW